VRIHVTLSLDCDHDRDVKAHGEYRTKPLILEIYDELAEAMKTGRPYQTRLDPPPADPASPTRRGRFRRRFRKCLLDHLLKGMKRLDTWMDKRHRISTG
jgi:hypothetical protein